MDTHVINLLLAMVCGALIGFEREYRDKAAGLRVLPMVSLGAALVTTLAGVNGFYMNNPHVAAGVVTGVGFLGAGVILQDKGQIVGVTTAATIWIAAAIGMTCGAGQYLLAFSTTAFTLLILWMFPHFDIFQTGREAYTFEIIAPFDMQRYEAYQQRFLDAGVRVLAHTLSRRSDEMIAVWRVEGRREATLRVAREFIADPAIRQCNVS